MSLYKKKEWRFLREEKLNINPVCEVCKSFYKLEIDHIVDHNQNLDLFFDLNNLQTLCKNHHSKKTISEMKLKLYKISDYAIYLKNLENKKFNNYVDFFDDEILAIENIVKNSEKILSDNYEVKTLTTIEVKDLKTKNIIDILKKTFFKNRFLPKIIYIDNELETKFIEIFLKNIYGNKKICLIKK